MAEPSTAGGDRLPPFAPGMSDDAGDLDLHLAWPMGGRAHEEVPTADVTTGSAPAGAPAPGAAGDRRLDEVVERLTAVEAQLERLTALVELVVDTMPGSSEGSAT